MGVGTHAHVPYARACVRVLVAPTSACTRTIIDSILPIIIIMAMGFFRVKCGHKATLVAE